ncbi:MAG: Lipopolysaccharide export LptBFGC system, permease protein LptF [Pelagibacterales bacterium]|jgi:lipopolysaccharide export system permease protein|nr:Lipopolysaccharide export LptBFGC system, permease protein LptF [Pelagibacterales bacterium]
MLQNKIYQNYLIEILKTFLVILFGLTIIAWTVRAVNFLDLIVESGYSISTYFEYSFLNLFSILTKFIPLAFLIGLVIFIVRQTQENEFVILWTSGVKKLKLVNLFFIISIIVLFFYLIFSTFLTPYALNKSRSILNQQGYNSFLPTIRIQQFSDSFKGFTFLVEKKFKNEIKNVFIHDSSNTLKSLTVEDQGVSSTTIVAEEGIVEEKKMVLFNGQIISANEDNTRNNLVKFSQLNIDLRNLQTSTIKIPKLQETSTIDLLKCIFGSKQKIIINCKENTKKEIITVINRRIILPFYIPIISLLCSLLLIRTKSKNNYFLNKYSIFFFSFSILLYAELIIRFTGISKLLAGLFIISPIILIPIIYLILIFKLSRESFIK